MADNQCINIGKEIEEHLKVIRMSPLELANKLDVSSQYVYSVLRGKRLGRKATEKWGLVLGVKPNWLLTGEGEMLTTPNAIQEQSTEGDVITIPKEVWGVIKSQADSLQSRDKQIDDLIRLLREQMDEAKRGHVRREDNAGSADAV